MLAGLALGFALLQGTNSRADVLVTVSVLPSLEDSSGLCMPSETARSVSVLADGTILAVQHGVVVVLDSALPWSDLAGLRELLDAPSIGDLHPSNYLATSNRPARAAMFVEVPATSTWAYVEIRNPPDMAVRLVRELDRLLGVACPQERSDNGFEVNRFLMRAVPASTAHP